MSEVICNNRNSTHHKKIYSHHPPNTIFFFTFYFNLESPNRLRYFFVFTIHVHRMKASLAETDSIDVGRVADGSESI